MPGKLYSVARFPNRPRTGTGPHPRGCGPLVWGTGSVANSGLETCGPPSVVPKPSITWDNGQKCKFLDPSPHPLNQNLGVGPRLPEDLDVG